MYRWVLILWALFFFPFINAEGQNISNEGTDFWAVFPTHDPSRNNNGSVNLAKVRIYITSKTNSEVTVTCGSFNSGLVNVPGNTIVYIDVPRADSYLDVLEANTKIVNKGIHVKVTPGRDKVAVFEHIYAGARSAASLILPKEALGREYYAMNYIQDISNGEVSKNFLVLVAVDPNTRLIVHKKDGSKFNIDFTNAGEVFEYMPANQEDLTGTYVEVDQTSPDNCNKRFAAYSGSTSLRIGCGGSRDPLFQQLYPTVSWGKKYGVIPFINRRHIFRILAQEDNTIVEFEGNNINLNKGSYYTSPELSNATIITSNKKISVAQYSLTQACTAVQGPEIYGDPEMVLLNPIEFNVKSTTLFSSDKEKITERYINVLIKASATSSFMIDGVAVNTLWTPVQSDPTYAYTQIRINSESSYLTANDGFNAVAYGFGDHESYAYSAGTNLAATNYFLIFNKITQHNSANACIGQESDFKIILPYQVTKITWKLDDGPEEIGSIINKVITATDGTLSYEYVYGREQTFTELRSHTIAINVELPNDGTGCLSGGAEFNYTFDVYPLPTTDFYLPDNNCADTELQFTDNSISNIPGKPLNKWFWDFEDGTTSSEQNPKHIFSTSGSFNVKLSTGLDDGCMSEVVMKTIIIGPKISPSFKTDGVGCINKLHIFEDQSFVEAGTTIVKWRWSFGDNTPVPIDDTLPVVSHTFTSLGTFKVKLIIETANGCKSLAYEREIIVTALPEAKFTLPQICSLDDIAEFENLSVDIDGTLTDLNYSWDFGDASSMINSSIDRVGKHKYDQPGVYTVKLTVTNINGCSRSTSKYFTVNGPDVQAVFEVLNKDKLCSGVKVQVVNKSFVRSIGSVIKLRLYFDSDDPDNYIEDLNPQLDKLYEFAYPELTTANPKHYTIKMVAYSGQSCYNELSQDILLHPSPSLSFDDIPSVCVNGGKVLLTQAHENIGIQGTSIYSGLGITREGLFDPQIAGIGTHDITYTFIADNGGCELSIIKNIVVYPIPVVTLPVNLYILDGGQKQIEASVSSSGNTYQWSPSEGLSKANVLLPVFTATSDRVYTLTVTTGAGCVIKQRVFVYIIKSVEPTNAFSPNGDGVNDVWKIKYLETYPSVTVNIFNRYGEKVFFSQGYSIPFDGNYRGQPLPVGTYYYMINPKNGKKTITGSLTLIR